MNDIIIRPHHALCAHFFEGKGYSEQFTLHMENVLDSLDRDNADVIVKSECDIICQRCPNNISGICTSEAKVSGIDKRAADAMELKAENTLKWRDLYRLSEKKIISVGKLKDVCRDCEWMSICEGKTAAHKAI